MANPYADERGVFRNKLGITDAGELKAAEYSLTARRLVELEAGHVTLDVAGYGLARLRAIHRHLFQDVYEWAGQVRTVPSSKRADSGLVTVFKEPGDIVSSWERLEQKTAAFVSASGMGLSEQREALATIFIEANRIHPFPEGNGRSTQAFMRQLAREQGLELDFTRTERREWNRASALSGTFGRLFEGRYLIPEPADETPIRQVFEAIARPARAVAFEQLPEADACARFPELRAAYDGLRALEERVRATGVDDAGVAGYLHQVRESFVKRLGEGELPRIERARSPQDRG